MDGHHCILIGVEGDLVVIGPGVEAVKEELEAAIIQAVVVNGGARAASSTYFHRALASVMASLMSIRTRNSPILVPWGTPQVRC